MSGNFLSKDARRFKITLSVCLTLTVIITAAAVVYSVKYIEGYSQTVKQSVYESKNSEDRIATISRLATQIQQQSDSVARVQQIVADSKQYEYQDVIINDLRSMAGKAGITILDFDFNSSADGKKKAATAAPAKGLHSSTVGITINNPVGYKNYLDFLHYIELNNTKMQVSSVSLSALTDGNNKGSINSETMHIEVYVK